MPALVGTSARRRCRSLMFCVVAFLGSLLLPHPPAVATTITPATIDVALDIVASDLDRPVQVVAPDASADRLFVVEQSGRIRIVRDGQVLPDPFLDISDSVSCCGERGLLSVV